MSEKWITLGCLLIACLGLVAALTKKTVVGISMGMLIFFLACSMLFVSVLNSNHELSGEITFGGLMICIVAYLFSAAALGMATRLYAQKGSIDGDEIEEMKN